MDAAVTIPIDTQDSPDVGKQSSPSEKNGCKQTPDNGSNNSIFFLAKEKPS